MESRMTIIETRFDTVLPNLATKADVRNLETRFDTILPTLATKADLKGLEVNLHREIRSNTWMIISWVTAVIGLAISGVFYIAKYVSV